MSVQRMRGTALIEIVIAIVVIGMAGATIVGLTTSIFQRSAETLISQQRGNIAAAYLREIMSQPFSDMNPPDGEARGGYDDVNDYAGLNEAPRDRTGNLLANFNGYTVNVAINQASLTTIPNVPANAIPAAQTYLIRIAVTDPFGGITRVAGIKTQHP